MRILNILMALVILCVYFALFCAFGILFLTNEAVKGFLSFLFLLMEGLMKKKEEKNPFA